MKLKTIKSKVSTAASKVSGVQPTERLRGRPAARRREAWLSQHPLCKHCDDTGRVSAATEVDHITPLALGGADDESNFQSLCTTCHQRKSVSETNVRAGSEP